MILKNGEMRGEKKYLHAEVNERIHHCEGFRDSEGSKPKLLQ